MNRLLSLNAIRVFAVAAAFVPALVPAATEHEVLRWNRLAVDAAATAETDPLTESRIFAMTHIAIHDALNAIDRRYEQYGRPFRVLAPASPEAAVASAALRVLTSELPASRATFVAAYLETLKRVPENAAKWTGIEIGNAIGESILERRRDDGSGVVAEYVPGTEPGRYRPTPPDFTPAAFPQWGGVTPFALAVAAQFRPAPPPAPGSARALADIAEVRSVGSVDSATRTPEQSEIAKFWYENSTQGWNRIAREIVIEHGADEWDAARLFALVHIAMADGFIGGFEAKYHYAYWRPATAIRETVDAEWLNFLPTPPVPDHPSTHTVLGAAAAAVLARVAGEDSIPFSMTSGAPYAGITRTFGSFSEAARENGDSRIYAGIHFRSAVTEGLTQGDRIGAFVANNLLKPAVRSRN